MIAILSGQEEIILIESRLARGTPFVTFMDMHWVSSVVLFGTDQGRYEHGGSGSLQVSQLPANWAKSARFTSQS